MRCNQWMGLNDKARDFLNHNCVMIPGDVCPKCGHVLNQKKDCKKREWIQGMFGLDYMPLIDFKLTDGRVASEVVQAEPWSSGPVFFVCLEIDGKRMFEWTQSEIDNA